MESLILDQLKLLSYYSKLNAERKLKKKQDEEFQAALKEDKKAPMKRKREILFEACEKRRRKNQTQ